MSIQEVSIPGSILSSEELKFQEPTPTPYPESLFKLPTLASYVGERGKGKTYSATKYMKKLADEGYISRIFAITPTWESNRVLHILPIRKEDVYSGPQVFYEGNVAIEKIIRKAEADADFYAAMKPYKETYEKFEDHRVKGVPYTEMKVKDRAFMEKMQGIIATQIEELKGRIDYQGNDNITPHDKFFAEHVNFPDEEFQRKRLFDTNYWPILFPPFEIMKPHPLLFIDDMSYSDIYGTKKTNYLVNLALRHRHIGEGSGISLLFLVQNFKSVPRGIRSNIQQFAMFKGCDLSVLEDVYEEFGGLATKDQFFQLYAQAVGNDPKSHDFLMIDKNAADPDKTFRRNYDTFLIPPPVSMEEILEGPAPKKQKRMTKTTSEEEFLAQPKRLKRH